MKNAVAHFRFHKSYVWSALSRLLCSVFSEASAVSYETNIVSNFRSTDANVVKLQAERQSQTCSWTTGSENRHTHELIHWTVAFSTQAKSNLPTGEQLGLIRLS
jgi:hypothetical protein